MKSKFDPNAEREIPKILMHRGFGDNRKLNSIQLILTTHCNRMCPTCVCKIPYLEKHEHTDVEWIKSFLAPKMQGLRLLQISGGEPSLHPQFKYITENIRDWFKPQMLTIFTNGTNLMRDSNFLGYYDHISISNFNRRSYPGSKDNAFDIMMFKYSFRGSSEIHHDVVKHVLDNDYKFPCNRGGNDIALVQWGKIYPCCAGSRVPEIGIEITENWREEVKKVELPCSSCPFALKKGI